MRWNKLYALCLKFHAFSSSETMLKIDFDQVRADYKVARFFLRHGVYIDCK